MLPWILNTMIYGAGKPFNVALIVPDLKTLEKLGEELNLSVTVQELFNPDNLAGQKLKDLLSLEIQNHLRKTFGGYEIPKKFIFIQEDFTVDNEMLTQTLKLKRRAVLAKYVTQLEALYAGVTE